jgi:hypothetical protein
MGRRESKYCENVSTLEQRRLCVPKHLDNSQTYDVMKPIKCSNVTDKSVEVLALNDTCTQQKANIAVGLDCAVSDCKHFT